MAKIDTSEPAIWAATVKIPPFHLEPDLVHQQGTPTNCYWRLRTLWRHFSSQSRAIPPSKAPAQATTKLAYLAKGSGVWQRNDHPQLLHSPSVTSCGSMTSAEGHLGTFMNLFSLATA